jgi:hypothetical protein
MRTSTCPTTSIGKKNTRENAHAKKVCMPKRMHVLISMKQKNRKQCKLQ